MNATMGNIIDPEENEKILSWPMVIAGSIFALALASMLHLLGVGSGFTALATGFGNAKIMTLGVFIWLLISSMLSLFLGGWLTGILVKHKIHPLTGAIHGIMIWAITTIIYISAITSGIGVFISGTSNVAATMLSGVTQAGVKPLLNIGSNISNETFNDIKETIIDEMNKNQINQNAINNLIPTIKQYLFSGGDKENLRNKISNVLAENSAMNVTQANEMIDSWINTYNEAYDSAKNKIKQGTQTVSATISTAFLSLFFINFLSGLVAIIGASIGYKGYYFSRSSANK